MRLIGPDRAFSLIGRQRRRLENSIGLLVLMIRLGERGPTWSRTETGMHFVKASSFNIFRKKLGQLDCV